VADAKRLPPWRDYSRIELLGWFDLGYWAVVFEHLDKTRIFTVREGRRHQPVIGEVSEIDWSRWAGDCESSPINQGDHPETYIQRRSQGNGAQES
jgi:hypothetical protein